MNRRLFPAVLGVMILTTFWALAVRDGPSGPARGPDRQTRTGNGVSGQGPQSMALGSGVHLPADSPVERTEAGAEMSVGQSAPVASAGEHSLALRVLSIDDLTPLPAVTCVLTDVDQDDKVLYRGETGADGRLTIRSVKLSFSHRLRLGKSGFLQEVRWLRSGLKRLQIVMRPGLAVSGRVLDARTLAPLAGVDIEAFLAGDDDAIAEGLQTDGEGRFSIPGIPVGGSLIIEATQKGRCPAVFETVVHAPRADVLLRMSRGESLDGFVFDQTGAVVSDAQVSVRMFEEGSDLPFEVDRTVTDEQGRYRFDGLEAPARYVVFAASERLGNGTSELFELLPGRLRARQDVLLRRGPGSLVVHVYEASGRPAALVELEITDEQGLAPSSPFSGELSWEQRFVREQGAYRITPIAPGRYRVSALPENGPRRSVWTQVEAHAHNVVTINLEQGEALVGLVRDPSGQPQAGVSVEFWFWDNKARPGSEPVRPRELDDWAAAGWTPARTRTDVAGKFRIEGLPAVVGILRVAAERGSATGFDAVFGAVILRDLLPGAAAVEVTLHPAPRIIGRFVPPPAGRSVECEADCAGDSRSGDIDLDQAGRFELHLPWVGQPFELTIDPGSGAPRHFEDLRLRAGEVKDLGRLALLPGGTIEGSITDSDGAPIAGAQVEVSVDAWSWWRGTVSDQSGRYRLEHLPQIAGDLEFEMNDYIGEHFALGNLGVSRRQDLTLHRGGVLEGQVLDAEGNAVAQATVSASFQGDDAPDPYWDDEATSDDDGVFDMHLKPGLYRVRVLIEDATSGGDAILVSIGEQDVSRVILDAPR